MAGALEWGPGTEYGADHSIQDVFFKDIDEAVRNEYELRIVSIDLYGAQVTLK